MNKMLEKALTELSRQPEDMQEFVASLIMGEIESEKFMSSEEGKAQLHRAIQMGLDQLEAGQGLKGQDVLAELKALQLKRLNG